MTSTLSILGTTIRQDAEGRFCLNDCHKASSGENKNRPSIWVDNSQTKALIAEIQAEAGIPALTSIKGGNASGTYACKELVYAYAMWISPAFHLTVIRAFDALVMQGLHSVKPLTREQKIAEAFVLLHEDHEKAKEQIAVLTPKAEGFDRFANSIGRTNLREVGKALDIGSKRGIELLRETKWIFRAQNGKWHAYADKIDAGYVEVKYATYTNTAGEEISTQQVFVTPKGMARLSTRLQQH
ncbi:phage antirepressor KilAC domain-containing protein [Acetobacter cerevisiae]|uniref:phage antirepressor KilAC domain-containing protein n=1 Tax=Acetobacter cerevisiae TaxID=178900 RepID=UPI00209CE382|nr:phage antirepressor KilAC domain-containing protein [Acetobacter cerevisiae]MCP1270534.1 phage antirepressor KilAC domain-containing protein [Acetobacter cerevisiae]MCP1278487.1 phage antirepressor KilAC domain-containing protein [Acetobacter cerevisiae]